MATTRRGSDASGLDQLVSGLWSCICGPNPPSPFPDPVGNAVSWINIRDRNPLSLKHTLASLMPIFLLWHRILGFVWLHLDGNKLCPLNKGCVLESEGHDTRFYINPQIGQLRAVTGKELNIEAPRRNTRLLSVKGPSVVSTYRLNNSVTGFRITVIRAAAKTSSSSEDRDFSTATL